MVFAMIEKILGIKHKKILGVCCLLVIIFAATRFVWIGQENSPKISKEERFHLSEQQNLTAAWFEKVQRSIEKLDYNWKQYHKILDYFDRDAIGIEVTFERLQRLTAVSKKQAQLLDESLSPPENLDKENFELAETIFVKIKEYANQQVRTFQATTDAADPAHLLSNVQPEQSRRLRDIMIVTSPAVLNIAEEVITLRDRLHPVDE